MLAMAGGKGGVGTTTCALALGAALGRAGREALVVEADYGMPDLARVAGVGSTDGDGDGEASTSPRERVPLAARARSVPGRPGLSVLPAGERAVAARPPLDGLDRWDGPVVIDCPSGAGRDAAAPLRAADAAMLVATPTRGALAGAATTARMARALGTRPVGALLTRSPGSPDGVRDLLGCPALAAVPRAERPLDDDRVQTVFDALSTRMVD
jgi:septum site-determining protein MinD